MKSEKIMRRVINVFLQPGFILAFLLYAGDSPLAIIGVPVQWPYSLTTMIFLSLLVSATACLRYIDNIPIRSALPWMVIGYGIYLLIGCFHSPDPIGGFMKALEYILIAGAGFFIPILFVRVKHHFRNIMLGVLSGSIILLLLGFAALASGAERVAVLGGGPNVYGRLMFFGFIASVSMLSLSETNKRKRIFGSVLGSAFIVLMLLSGSRGVLLGCAGSLFFILFFSFRHIRFRLVVTLLLIALMMGTGFVLIVGFGDRNLAVMHVMHRYKYYFQDPVGSQSIAFRAELLSIAWMLFRDSPIFGQGTNSFPALVGLPNAPYPHNLIMETLAEGGMVGLFLLLLILLPSSIKAISILRYKSDKLISYRIFAASGYVFSLITAQVSGDLSDSRYIFFFSGLITAISSDIMKARAPGRS